MFLLYLQITDPMNVSKPDSSFASVSEFILLGFPFEWQMQSLFFSLFTTTYILTITGNGAILCAVWCDQRLHTPMYIFLGNFSFLEIWYVSSTVPKMLVNFITDPMNVSKPDSSYASVRSHLAVVSLFYGSLMVMYVSPGLGHSAGMQKVATLFYAMVTPLFNPLIYSLRNKDMKAALRKVVGLSSIS
ncbi:olfactory receptor 11H1-like [Echinops telfairi]|uniref:Olfactory receptor 11H1-like n=1 Tax=Echinops telfairi TaxID=9371 RepID=A0AC55CVU3_ECHTE|nr:olfactory receptor 11H1-like [Echinops telfairi]